MKIQKNNTIRIAVNNPALDKLRNIKKGARVSADIVKTINSNEAILSIAGKKMRVEFLKGVPNTDKLYLMLDSNKKNTFYFKIIDKAFGLNSLKEISDLSIFDFNDLKKTSPGQIYNYLKSELTDIYSLNMLFLRILKGRIATDENRVLELLKKLMQSGLDKKDIMFFSMLLNGNRGFNFEHILSFLSIFRQKKFDDLYKNRNLFKNKDYLQKNIEILTEKIAKLAEKEESNSSIIKDLLDLISDYQNTKDRDYNDGNIIYFSDNECESIKYIISKNSIVFSFNMSYIGHTDVLIKYSDSKCNISIFCENTDKIKILQNEISNLQSLLTERTNMVVDIIFYNKKKTMKKIIEIYSSLNLINIVDVKV